MDDPRKAGLALRLDDGTRKSHSAAQNTAFVSGFFKGIADRNSFAQLVTSLYFVYEAMERELDAAQDGRVKALDFPELRRTRSLEEDMAYFYGPDWRAVVRPSPATRRYVAHIAATAARKPALLIAHQYTRYLGDLFGGQMMAGMAVKSLDLVDGQGVSFYRFPDIPEARDFITEWYRTLNGLSIPEALEREIVAEANVVFQLNIDLLAELDGNALVSALRLTWASIVDRIALNVHGPPGQP